LTRSLPNVKYILTNEAGVQRITLSRPVAEVNQLPQPFTGAAVMISHDDSAWQLNEDTLRHGNYCTPAWFAARLGKNYTLLISSGGKVWTAKAVMEQGQEFNELHYKYNDDKGLYYVDWVANAFSTGPAAMWELLIDWSAVPGYDGRDSTDTHARLLFYTLPTLDVSEVFAPMMESVYFPAGAWIEERRYSLTPQHAEYIREVLLETRWTGGLFPVASSNATGNVSGGALGYFGACWVNKLSVVVTP
ncbi:MAG TPA: hypothetical protein PLK82_04460, partial [Bacteroidales bacterium]|nr:hypothetical protein [Bacteroidales bacterium]